MKRFATAVRIAMAALGALAAIACGNSFSGGIIGVGNTPNVPPQTSLNLLGTPGTPFAATVTDPNVSWQVQGSLPMTVVLLNNAMPVWMVATKLTSGSNLLSLQAIGGGTVAQLSSTVAPFGTVQVSLGGVLNSFAPPANPDVRVFVRGSARDIFNGLIEDSTTGFIVQQTAPALYLFEAPDGKIDAQLNQVSATGPLIADLQFGHPPGPPPVVKSVSTNNPTLVIAQP